ncbi:pentapeptide repeat-containing protein [Caballeronia telluris]|uniref:Pentapeptide repeat-containing protein n=1 Tax=Caballeronia telluris TaxID=326475 RepID=A0A158KFQ3_9BURK|nr:pentapeptide repeat-containing protein [Caballeronia telluris]SAL79927.1 hypothetical protein AWB66_06147 [Caballeronia telluris]
MRTFAALVLLIFVQLPNAAHSKAPPRMPPEAVCSQHERGWSPDERVVWKTACKAQGPYREDSMDDSKPPVIRAEFLRDLLTKKIYSEKLSLTGLGLSRVRVREDVWLNQLTIPGGLWFDNVTFEDPVHLDGTRVQGPVEFNRSEVPKLTIQGATIQGALTVSSTAIVLAKGAHIEGDLMIDGGISPEEVRLADRERPLHPVEGTPSYGSPSLRLAGARVEGGIVLQHLPSLCKVDAKYMEVKGPISVVDSGVDNLEDLGRHQRPSNLTVDMSHVEATQDLVIRQSDVGVLNLNEAKIKGSFRAEASAFQRIDAQGVRITQEFVLDPFDTESAGGRRPRSENIAAGAKWWPGASSLDLSNARMSRIVSPRSLEVWPESIMIRDARFDSFISYPAVRTGMETVELAEDEWLKDWLARATKKRFDPQPYQQVTSMATMSGLDAIAVTVGFAKRERERCAACEHFFKTGLDCVYLTFSRLVIGYGYHYFRTVLIALGFILLGTIGFRFVPQADRKGLRYGVAYSLDMFLPVINLRKRHENVDISNGIRYYFYVHKLAGWIIGIFLAAGLAGFTK